MFYIYRYIKHCPKAETDEELVQNSSDYYDINFQLRFKDHNEAFIYLCKLVKLKTLTPWVYKVSLDNRLNNTIKPIYMLEIFGEYPLFFDSRSLLSCQRYQESLFEAGIKSIMVSLQKNMIKSYKK